MMDSLTFPALALLLLAGTATHAQQPAAKPQPPAATPVPSPGQAPPATPVAPAVNPDMLACNSLAGHVTNNYGQPLTGATVLLRGRTKGFSVKFAITNAEGKYLLTSNQPIPVNSLLEISAGGYTTFAQALSNCRPIEASLEPLPGTRFKSDGRIKKTSASGKIH